MDKDLKYRNKMETFKKPSPNQESKPIEHESHRYWSVMHGLKVCLKHDLINNSPKTSKSFVANKK